MIHKDKNKLFPTACYWALKLNVLLSFAKIKKISGVSFFE